MNGGDWQATVHGVSELDMTEQLHFHCNLLCSSFPRFLKLNIGYLILHFFLFKYRHLKLQICLQATLQLHLTGFDMLYFYYHSVQNIFNFFFMIYEEIIMISFFTHEVFRDVLFNSETFGEHILYDFDLFLLIRLASQFYMVSILVKIPCKFFKKSVSCSCRESVLKCHLGQVN